MKIKKNKIFVVGVAIIVVAIGGMFGVKRIEMYQEKQRSSEMYVCYEDNIFWEEKWPQIEELFYEKQEDFNYFAGKVISYEGPIIIWYDYDTEMYYGRDYMNSLNEGVIEMIKGDERLNEFLHSLFQTRLLNHIEINGKREKEYINFCVNGLNAGVDVAYNPSYYESLRKRKQNNLILAEKWVIRVGIII